MPTCYQHTFSAKHCGDQTHILSTFSTAWGRYNLLPSLELDCLAENDGNLFARRNRLSLPGTLHRVSAMKRDDGQVHGLTYRIGRHLPGQ